MRELELWSVGNSRDDIEFQVPVDELARALGVPQDDWLARACIILLMVHHAEVSIIVMGCSQSTKIGQYKVEGGGYGKARNKHFGIE